MPRQCQSICKMYLKYHSLDVNIKASGLPGKNMKQHGRMWFSEFSEGNGWLGKEDLRPVARLDMAPLSYGPS